MFGLEFCNRTSHLVKSELKLMALSGPLTVWMLRVGIVRSYGFVRARFKVWF